MHNFAVLFRFKLVLKESIFSMFVPSPTAYTAFTSYNLEPFYIESSFYYVCNLYNHVLLTDGLTSAFKQFTVYVIRNGQLLHL